MGDAVPSSDHLVAFTIGSAVRFELARMLELAEKKRIQVWVISSGPVFQYEKSFWTDNGRGDSFHDHHQSQGREIAAKKNAKADTEISFYVISRNLRQQSRFLQKLAGEGDDAERKTVFYLDPHVSIPVVTKEGLLKKFGAIQKENQLCKVWFSKNFRSYVGEVNVVAELLHEYNRRNSVSHLFLQFPLLSPCWAHGIGISSFL